MGKAKILLLPLSTYRVQTFLKEQATLRLDRIWSVVVRSSVYQAEQASSFSELFAATEVELSFLSLSLPWHFSPCPGGFGNGSCHVGVEISPLVWTSGFEITLGEQYPIQISVVRCM